MFTAAGKSAAASSAVYVEDVFSTYVYTGTGANRSIVNGIDLAGKGGLVWIKDRNLGQDHSLFDTSRGVNKYLSSNQTNAEATAANSLTAFNSDGFNLGTNASWANVSPYNYVAWTFREQEKFFDVVTYTGDGVTTGRAISHNLKTTPGFIIVKRINGTSSWECWHRGLNAGTGDGYIRLNSANAGVDSALSVFGSASSYIAPTSTNFTVGSVINANGATYVAYLFAHNAGGFGAAGTDNVITCGSYIGNGSATGPTVTLGYEPQWVMIKRSSSGGTNWEMLDSMRGLAVATAGDNVLSANLANTETSAEYISLTATGFNVSTSSGEVNSSGNTYIYIAVRRGPMKTPTSGTSVFSPVIGNSSSSSPFIGFTTSFALDAAIYKARAGSVGFEAARLTGNLYLQTSSNAAQASSVIEWDRPTGFGLGSNVDLSNYIGWMFQRAPGFFDVVCYSGNGSARSVNHSLGVAPEFLMIKRRNSSGGSFPDDWSGWTTYATPNQNAYVFGFNQTSPWRTLGDVYWGASQFGTPNMTATTFSLGTYADVNASSGTYIAYLFATLPGVSKVGAYTGNGSSQTINCGFAAGSRFVLIKRLDVNGSWYVWDSARGIVAGNDPYLQLNNTAAEVNTNDTVDTDSSGFVVNQLVATDLNVLFSPYFFLAIA